MHYVEIRYFGPKPAAGAAAEALTAAGYTVEPIRAQAEHPDAAWFDVTAIDVDESPSDLVTWFHGVERDTKAIMEPLGFTWHSHSSGPSLGLTARPLTDDDLRGLFPPDEPA